LKLLRQHSRQAARVEGGIIMQRTAVNVASAVARLQLQQQHINCNNQPAMIALTTGVCATGFE